MFIADGGCSVFEGGIENRSSGAELLKSSHKENCLKLQRVFRVLQGYCTLYHCLLHPEAPPRLAIEHAEQHI